METQEEDKSIMKIRFNKKEYNEEFIPFTIMEVPIPDDLIQDCYAYNQLDAPGELKIFILEQVAMAFDKCVIENAPHFTGVMCLKNKLEKVEIRYKVD